MTSDTAFNYILRTYNWTGDANGDQVVNSSDLPFQALPSVAISPDGSGIYTLNYAFLTSATDAETVGFGSSSYVVNNFDYDSTAAGYQSNVLTTILGSSSILPGSAYFSDIAKIQFSSSSVADADITIGQIADSSGGFFGGDHTDAGFTYNYTPTVVGTYDNDDPDLYGKVFLNQNFYTPWTSGFTSANTIPGQVGFWAILHELGHALGLKHPDDSGDGIGADTAINNQHYTIMSYVPEGWTLSGGSYTPTSQALYDGAGHPLFAYGLQLEDIAAIRAIYGPDYTKFSDNTLYDYSSGLGRGGSTSNAFISTFADGGGVNIIDTTGFSGAVKLDLREGAFSSIGSNGNGQDGYDPSAGRDIDNVAIAYHSVIQNAIVTQDNSVLIGNQWSDALFAEGNNSKIYSDGIVYDNSTGFITAVSGDSSDPNNSIPSIQNDILIGGAGSTTFYSSLGSNVIVGFYDKSIIDSATSSWTTYWDAAGQFTGVHNATGAALATVTPSGTPYGAEKVVDYSALNAAGNVTLAGGDLHIEFTGTSSSWTVAKNTATACLGTDQLFGFTEVVGTKNDDTFSGTDATPYSSTYVTSALTGFLGSEGNDSYNFTDGYGVNYSSLSLLPGVHLNVTASDSGITVDKYDSSGLFGEDTVVATTSGLLNITGTGGNDTFVGYDANTLAMLYTDTGSNNSFTFDLATFDASATALRASFEASVFEDGSGNVGDIHFSNFDSGTMTSFYTVDENSADVFNVSLLIEKFNATLSLETAFSVQFTQEDSVSLPDLHTITIGSTTYETGGVHNDTIAGASGNHVIDGGPGTNTIDYSAATGGVTANLSTGTVSNNGWGYSDTLQNITVIIDSHHNDSITGNGATTTVSYADATSGVTVDLSAGTATGDGSDTLSGVPNVIGSSHNDIITSNSANNVIDGGGGTNTISYAAASSAVVVDLSAGTATGDGNDTLVNIQSVIGSANDGDTLIGNSGDNTLDGGGGVNDAVSYQSALSAVTVNLSTGTATGDGNDTLLNIGVVLGSQYNDTLIGPGNLYGLAGNDTLENGTIHYNLDPAGVTVNLATGTATDGWGDTDTLIGITHVTGSSYNDTITADSNADFLFGGTGNDTYIFSSGFGNSTVSENTSSGTDTIHFTGIDPSHIRMYTNSSGNLLLQDTTHTSTLITVLAGTTGSGTDESTIGQRVEQITFDDVNNTVWSLTGGLTLTGTTSGETLYGTAFGDVINGMGGADTIYGNGGNDTISSGSGNDVLDGGTGTDTISYAGASSAVTVNLATTTAQNTVGAGTDTITNFENLTGSAFNDTLTGDGNANTIDGGAGNDVMNGAGGIDTLTYASASAGITISLAITTGQATGGSGTDTISNFENLTGSAFNDTLTGDANANTISGGAGNDVIAGRGGADVLDGGAGTNTVDYSAAAAGVTVNLSTGTASNDGDGSSDTLTNFANITGSAFNDTLTGDANANTISGGAGNDIIVGHGGADVLDGGAGTDTVDYSAAAAGVNVSLALGTASNDGDGSSDTLTNFENVTGSAFNDTIEGGAGNNVLVGGAGTDTLSYADATAGVTVNLATTTAQNTVGAGTDTISGFENLTGSAFADTLTGDGNNNVIEGLSGNDVLVGGLGTDTVSYEHAASAVTVSLATTVAQNTVGAGTDTISGFENLTGSAFNDTLTGDSNANVIQGLAGNDILSGGPGNDTLDGGTGTNTATFSSAASGVTVDLHAGTATGDGSDTLINIQNVTGSSHNDTIVSNSGNNVLDGGAGTDTVSYAPAASHVTVDLSAGTATGDGNDTLSHFENVVGSAYNDTLTGDTNANTLTGGAGDDTLTGGGGADFLYGGTGSDTFLFLAAHAFSAIVKIEDFTTGSGNDKIDIKDVISGYDPATMAITDWVQITTSGSDSILKVDIDGTGTAHTWQQIATIVGVTGLTDEAALVASGNLVVH